MPTLKSIIQRIAAESGQPRVVLAFANGPGTTNEDINALTPNLLDLEGEETSPGCLRLAWGDGKSAEVKILPPDRIEAHTNLNQQSLKEALALKAEKMSQVASDELDLRKPRLKEWESWRDKKNSRYKGLR